MLSQSIRSSRAFDIPSFFQPIPPSVEGESASTSSSQSTSSSAATFVEYDAAEANRKADLCLDRAHELYRQKEATEALQALQEGFAAHPTDPNLKAELHCQHFLTLRLERKQIQSSIRAMETRLRVAPVDSNLRKTVQFYRREEDRTKNRWIELRTIQEGLKANPTNPNRKAELCMYQSDWWEEERGERWSHYSANAAKEGLAAHPIDPFLKIQLYACLGRALYHQGKYKEVIVAAKQGLAEKGIDERENAEGKKYLTNLLQQAAAQIESSSVMSSSKNTSDPKQKVKETITVQAATTPSSLAERHFDDALRFYHQHQWDKTLVAIQAGLDAHPTDADLRAEMHLRQAKAWDKQGKRAECMRAIQLGLKAYPKDPDLTASLHLYQAICLERDGMQESQVIAAAQAGLSSNPTDAGLRAQLYTYLARALYKQGRHWEAIQTAQAGLAEKEAEEQEKEELTKILESSAKKIEITVEAAPQLTSLDRAPVSFSRLSPAQPISSSTSSAHIASPMQKKEKENSSLRSSFSTETQSSPGSSTTSLELPQSPPSSSGSSDLSLSSAKEESPDTFSPSGGKRKKASAIAADSLKKDTREIVGRSHTKKSRVTNSLSLK